MGNYGRFSECVRVLSLNFNSGRMWGNDMLQNEEKISIMGHE